MESTDIIYQPNWIYDVWSDIETIYPKGNKVACRVCSVKTNYAFMMTLDGYETTCYVSKWKINCKVPISDLTEEIRVGDELEGIVKDYNVEKKQLLITLNLSNNYGGKR